MYICLSVALKLSLYLSVYLSLPLTLYISLSHSLPFSLSLPVCLCLKFFLGCPIRHPHFVIFVYACVIAYNSVYGAGVRTHDLSLSFYLPLSLLNYLSNVSNVGELKSRLQNSQSNVHSLSHSLTHPFLVLHSLKLVGQWSMKDWESLKICPLTLAWYSYSKIVFQYRSQKFDSSISLYLIIWDFVNKNMLKFVFIFKKPSINIARKKSVRVTVLKFLQN